KDRQQVTVQWKGSDFCDCLNKNNVNLGGGQFVSANQVLNLANKCISEETINFKVDGAVSNDIKRWIDEAISSVLKDININREDTTLINQAEKALAKGLGLDLKDYQPITSMFELYDSLCHLTSFETANHEIREWWKRNRESHGASVSVSAPLIGDLFSGSVNANYDQINEMINKGVFSNQASFMNHLEKLKTSKGLQPVFTSRSLNLVEGGSLSKELKKIIKVIGVELILKTTSKKKSMILAKEDDRKKTVDRFKSLTDQVTSLSNTITSLSSTIEKIISHMKYPQYELITTPKPDNIGDWYVSCPSGYRVNFCGVMMPHGTGQNFYYGITTDSVSCLCSVDLFNQSCNVELLGMMQR
ncbi:predicted protein, partial [Naegleria gruberi]